MHLYFHFFLFVCVRSEVLIEACYCGFDRFLTIYFGGGLYHVAALKHTYQPRYSQYLTHAHNFIIRAVVAMVSCFALIGDH